MRRAAKRDDTEKPIREALHAVGCRTWPLSGSGQPDLLILTPPGVWLVAEVKNKQGRNRPTPAQTRESGPWPTIRTPQEALDLLNGSASVATMPQEGSLEALEGPSKPRMFNPGTPTLPKRPKPLGSPRKADRDV